MTDAYPEPGIDDALCVATSYGATRLIWLNQSKRRNALSPPLREMLTTELSAAMADGSVRAIVISGVGGCFCAGGDISTMKDISAIAGRNRMEHASALMRNIVEGTKPVIAAVEGWAIGAGLSLAAACDLVVTGRDAKFSLPFGKLGLIPDLGSLFTLPARIGMGKTKWMLMTRRLIDAEQAEDWGLVEEVVDTGDALDHAMTLAAEVAEGAPLTNAYGKQLLARQPLGFSEFLAAEADAQAILFTTDDFAEGAEAFFDKRPAKFTGR